MFVGGLKLPQANRSADLGAIFRDPIFYKFPSNCFESFLCLPLSQLLCTLSLPLKKINTESEPTSPLNFNLLS